MSAAISPPPAVTPFPRALAERYAFEAILGEGALGRTYRAHDLELDAPVAIKELLPARLRTWKDFDLFVREAETLRSLRHPGIPRYLAHLEVIEDGRPRFFLVQELIDGHTLTRELAAGPLDEASVVTIATQVLHVLVYLQGLTPPIVHRDIKPDNIMRRADGRLALIDFGAVREVLDHGDRDHGSTMVGTFGYMAPEQYAGQATPQSDLFGLGATCVHLLTGRSPESLFDTLFHIRIPDALPLTIGFRRWLQQLLQPDPGQRFDDARQALDALERGFLMRPLARPAPLPPDPGRPPRPAPGFHHRDPYAGRSYVFSLVLGSAAVLLTLPATVAFFASSTPPIGGAFAMVTLAAAALLSTKWRTARAAIADYRRWEHTVGEVTRAYENGGLEYRYIAAGQMRDGYLRTRCKVLRGRVAGDPIAVLYDPRRPNDSRPFIG